MSKARLHRGAAAAVLSATLLLCATPRPQALQLDALKDGIAFGVSAAFAGASELLVRYAPPIRVSPEASYDALSPMDTVALYPYSEPVDLASTVLEAAALLTPVLMSVAGNPSGFLTDAVAYGESFGFAMGTKNIVKYLLPRYRPYVYEGGAPGVAASEDLQSFPSGHAAMTFTAAAFSTYMFIHGLPGSAPLLPFVLANYALAGLTGSYRVLSGMHFPSDVLAGAAIGMVCGLVFPLLFRT